MLRCYITDRKLLPSGVELLDVIARNLANGVHWIQIREKDLSASELYALLTQALALPRLAESKILLNTRVDVAVAAGAHGAHLPSGSPSPRVWRAVTPAGFLLGVSCHTVEEVRAAESEGADYAVFGPVFAPRSKATELPPAGLDALREASLAVAIPVLALGGISLDNASDCHKAGSAGIAAISLFQS